MTNIKNIVGEYATDINYKARADEFLQLRRWTGDNPLLLLADAAGSTTGQNYFNNVKPSVERFQTQFIDSGRVTSFAELASIDPQDLTLQQIFKYQRKRHVLVEGAYVLSEIDCETDLARLQYWAHHADPYNHNEDPIGRIKGVGLRTFQYLRMLAGVDTVKPDTQVIKFIEKLSNETGNPNLDPSKDETVLKSCEWLAEQTGYRMIDIDQIAWWHFSDTTERH